MAFLCRHSVFVILFFMYHCSIMYTLLLLASIVLSKSLLSIRCPYSLFLSTSHGTSFTYLQEITDELSDTPKTVISVTIPGASTGAIADTSGANKSATVKKPVKDAGKTEGGSGGGANKTKK